MSSWHHMHEDGSIWNHIVDNACPLSDGSGRPLKGTYSGPECNCPSGELREFGHGSPCPQYRHFLKLNALPAKYDHREVEDRRLGQPWSDTMIAPGHDPVKHPSHYTSHPSGLECWDVTRHMKFNLGNAIKYIWRCDLKGKPIEDLEKAVEYLQDEIAMRKKAAGDE